MAVGTTTKYEVENNDFETAIGTIIRVIIFVHLFIPYDKQNCQFKDAKKNCFKNKGIRKNHIYPPNSLLL